MFEISRDMFNKNIERALTVYVIPMPASCQLVYEYYFSARNAEPGPGLSAASRFDRARRLKRLCIN